MKIFTTSVTNLLSRWMRLPTKFKGFLFLTPLVFVVSQSFAQNGSWTTKASMPTARWAMGLGEINGVIYAAGGYNSSIGGHLITVEAYDVVTNSWSSKANRLGIQTGPGSSVINSVLYTAGGSDCCVNTPNLSAFSKTNNSWLSKTAPSSPHGNGPASGVINGLMYVGGGRTLDGNNINSLLEEYTPASDSWTNRMPMNTPRSGVGSAVIDGLLYVVGGKSSSGTVGTLEVYNPITNVWTTKTSMPTPRFDLVAGAINGILYAVGGNNGQHLTTVESYNPNTDTWRSETSMPTARTDARGVVVNGMLYVVGGYSGSSTALGSVEVFTPYAMVTHEWFQQTSTATSNLWGVSFMDDKTGFVCGDNGTILKTTDSGLNWQAKNSGTTYQLSGIQIIDSKTGYASSYSDMGGKLLKTTDGGTVWNNISLNKSNARSAGFLFLNVDTGFISIGDTNYSHCKILKTTNGGTSWDTVYMGGTGWISYMNFPDNNNGYATVSGSSILKTTDGGAHWNSLNVGGDLWMSGVYFFNKDTGFVGGGDFNSGGGSIFKTTNGGTSWQILTTAYGVSIMVFPSPKNGYAIGSNTNWSVKKIIKTTDGGISWGHDTTTKKSVNGICFSNDNNGYAVGDSGTILKYSGVTGVSDASAIAPLYFGLSQNYPNPFNPTTTIEYKLPKDSRVRIVVFDMIGRQVKTVVDEEKSGGSYKVEFNASSLSSGVYFYRLTSDGLIQTKKMILMK